MHLIWKTVWQRASGQNNNNNKPPRKPPIFTPSENHKDIKKKASEIKQKLLKLQKDKLKTSNLNGEGGSRRREVSKSIRESRNWKHKIIIEQRQDLSLEDKLKKVQFELDASTNQKKLFKKSINNIKKGKENFYPDESKYLWKDYIEVIKSLRSNLKSMKKNLKKQRK